MNDREKVGLNYFFVLLFIVSWISAAPMVLASHHVQVPAPARILQVLMLFGAGLVAIFASWRNGGRKQVKSLLQGLLVWRASVLWYIAVLAGPAIIFLASLMLSNMMGETHVTFPNPQKFFTAFGTTFAVYFVLNTEEIAWRGYALPRLQSRFGALKASGIIGLLWMLFHIPLFLIKGGHPAGYPFWLFAIMIFSWTIPFTVVYNGTGGSILLAHILHQSMNAAVEALPIYPIAAKSLVPMMVSTAVSLILSVVLIWRRIGLKDKK